MTPKKMAEGREKIYFKKIFCPIFYFMTHLFPTAQLVETEVWKPKAIKKNILIVLFMFCWIK